MKKISEETPSVLQKVSEDTPGIARPETSLTRTPSDGYGTEVTNATTRQRPRPDQAKDIAWKLSTIKLWQIQPDDQKAAKTALKLLAWATIPATIDEAVYWLTRFVAHFPRRDSTQDAIIISDLSSDLVEAEVSLIAIVTVADELRKAASKKNPWLPPSGEVLRRCIDRSKSFRAMETRLSRPTKTLPAPSGKKNRLPPPWQDKSWEEMDTKTREALWRFLNHFHSDTRKTYCRIIGVDYVTVLEWSSEKKEVDTHGTKEKDAE